MEKIDSKSASQELDKFEKAITDLRMKYDRYFFGLERRAPEDDRKKMDKWLLKLLNYFISSTQLRFRREMLVQRYNSYARMWDRICAQIEAGTYLPDVLKADRRIGKYEAAEMAYRRAAESVPKPEAKPEPEPKAEPKPESKPAPEPSPTEKLYQQFIKARKSLGQSTSIPLDQFRSMLDKQIQQIKKKHGYTKIELRVTIEGDKVKIKGTPIK